MRIDVPVVVVGGGLAGLTTAYGLHKHGIDSLVLEAQPRLGGRIQTITFPDGVTAEAHMEEFWQSSPAYPLLRELGLPLVEDRAHSSVVLQGDLCQYQGEGERDSYLRGLFDPAERGAYLAWDALAGSVLRRLAGRPDPAVTAGSPLARLARTSMRSFVTATVRAQRVAEWVRLVVESETAVEWDQISALDGIAELRPFLDTAEGFGEANAHVAGGNDRLVEALVARLPNGRVQTRANVTRVDDRGGHVEVRHRGAGGAIHVTRCEQVVLTLPSWSLRHVDLRPGPAAAARTALQSAAAGSYVKVVLRLRAEARQLWSSYGPGLFTLLSDGPAGCIYLGGGAPVEGLDGRDLVLTMLLHGRHARALNGAPTEAIISRAAGHLEHLSASPVRGGRPAPLLPGVSRLVTDARAFDYPAAVAYWPVRRRRCRFDALAAALRAPHGRVHIGGDTTECSHSDGAVRSADRMVAVIAERLGVRGGNRVWDSLATA